MLQRSHRAAWLIYRGPIPAGYDIDHKCDKVIGGPPLPDRKCVNPEHLEVVTHAENMRRMQEHNEAAKAVFAPALSGPEQMLIWAEELIDESGFELIEPIAVMNVEGAPWRRFEYEFEDGLKTEEAPFALLAIFLHLLRSGVERSVAVRHILKMNPFSIKRWNQNDEWRNDIMAATRSARTKRWVDLEGHMMDTADRNMDRWQGRDVVNWAKVIEKHIEFEAGVINPKHGAVQLIGGNNVFISLPPGATLDDALDIIDSTARDVTNDPEPDLLPPPNELDEAPFE